MNKLKTILFTLLALMTTMVMAQQVRTLTGVVVDDFNEPIPGANIVVSNQQNRALKGTVTDIDGNFVLTMPPGEKFNIQISYIGMKTQRIEYKGQTTLKVKMSEDSRMLAGAEVTAQRVERSELGVSFREQTSATQKISMVEITEVAPVASIEEALQGQAAGLDIVLGGDPGAKSSIRIRGTSTLSSNADPLVVIDGIPTSTSFGDDFDFSNANEDDFGALLNISPSDIESIEVLKDAASTAIYGTSGANGVLLITTKQGKTGKTNFSFTSKFSIKEEPDPIPLLNASQYIAMIQDAVWNAANANGLGNSSALLDLLYNRDELLQRQSLSEFKYYREYAVDTDWLETVKQNAWQWDNSFSVSGGGDKATYILSLGYLDDVGTTIGTEQKRLTAKSRVTYKFSDKFRVYTDFNFVNTDKYANYTDNDGNFSGVRAMAQAKMPNESPYLMNDAGPTVSYFQPWDGCFQGTFNDGGNYNPLAMANESYYNTNVRQEKMTIDWEWRPYNWLRYEGWVSMDMKSQVVKSFLPQVATGVLWTSTYANRSAEKSTDNFLLQTQNKIQLIKTFAEKHSIVATALVKTSHSSSSSSVNETYANVSANLSDPVVGSIVAAASSGESQTRKVQFTESLAYTYDGRYSLNANFNTEGNSAMGKNKRFATFPSMGVAWNISEEHWFDNYKKVFTQGKIRYSLGWSGTAPSSGYTYMGAYSSLGNYMDIKAIYPNRMQLDKLKWESKREWDVGVDLRFFDRYSLTFDYYDNYVSDCLTKKYSIPSTTGYAQLAYSNSGEVSNKGWELRFDLDLVKTENWKFTLNFNCARNINKVEVVPDNYNENVKVGNGPNNYNTFTVAGDPIGSFYGFRYLGVYQNVEDTYARDAAGNVMTDFNGDRVTMINYRERVYPGDAKYEDINHDGVIDANDIVYLGNSYPTITGGGGFALKYGNTKNNFGMISLNVLLHGRYGQKVINAARMNLENMHGTNNQSTAVLNRWRKEGDDTDMPRALYGMGYNYLPSDRYVEDASYMRVKSISLSWALPKKWLAHIGFNTASIYVTGYDLFTFTSYSGQNPEVSLPSKASDLVKDGSTTPVSKRFACGINLNF